MPAMLFGSTGMGKTRIVQREHGSRYRSAARHHPVAGGGLQMPTPHERDF
jgi:hypothetical protein